MKQLHWIRSICGTSMHSVWLLCAIRCASALIAVAYALLMQQAIDAAVAQDASAFWPALSIFAAALLAQVCLSAASKWLSESSRARLENALRAHAAATILHTGRLPKQHNTGEASTVLTSDAACVAESVVSIIPEAVSMIVRAVAAFAVMFIVAAPLAVFFLAAGAICLAVSLPMRRWLKKLHANTQEAEGRMRSRLQETLESLVVIRSLGAQKHAAEKLNVFAQNYLVAQEKRATGKTASGTVFNLAMQASYLAGFGYGCWGILTGQVSYGTLMALVQLVGQIRTPFASFSGLFPQVATLSASCERLRALEPEQYVYSSPSPHAHFSSLEFRDVSYAFEAEKPVLENFDASIKAGEFIAITGPSGIGKTTLLSLVLGIDKPAHGTVDICFSDASEIDSAKGTDTAGKPGSTNGADTADEPGGTNGVDTTDSTTRETDSTDEVDAADEPDTTNETGSAINTARETFPAHELAPGTFAYVPQGNMLMSGTIRDVVTFGNEADEKRFRDALRIACAETFVNALPKGADTELGERGEGLSEGQMQRLSVARAIYSNAPVLLLDECTSALDEDTERDMLQQLRQIEKTVIIVSHRPAALEICDRQIKLDSDSSSSSSSSSNSDAH